MTTVMSGEMLQGPIQRHSGNYTDHGNFLGSASKANPYPFIHVSVPSVFTENLRAKTTNPTRIVPELA